MKLKSDFTSASDFYRYRVWIKNGLKMANTDFKTQKQVEILCNNIISMLNEKSRIEVTYRRSKSLNAKEQISTMEQEISEAIDFLNDNYVLELLKGDFNV